MSPLYSRTKSRLYHLLCPVHSAPATHCVCARPWPHHAPCRKPCAFCCPQTPSPCQIHFSLSHRPLCSEPLRSSSRRDESVSWTLVVWLYLGHVPHRTLWVGAVMFASPTRMRTLPGQKAYLTHFYFHSKWNIENKCWNY